MVITAKYTSKCLWCKKEILVGDKVEWKKGKGCLHADCESDRLEQLNEFSHLPSRDLAKAGLLL